MSEEPEQHPKGHYSLISIQEANESRAAFGLPPLVVDPKTGEVTVAETPVSQPIEEPPKPKPSIKSILVTTLRVIGGIVATLVALAVCLVLLVWGIGFVVTTFGFKGVAALCAIWFLAWIFWR